MGQVFSDLVLAASSAANFIATGLSLVKDWLYDKIVGRREEPVYYENLCEDDLLTDLPEDAQPALLELRAIRREECQIPCPPTFCSQLCERRPEPSAYPEAVGARVSKLMADVSARKDKLEKELLDARKEFSYAWAILSLGIYALVCNRQERALEDRICAYAGVLNYCHRAWPARPKPENSLQAE